MSLRCSFYVFLVWREMAIFSRDESHPAPVFGVKSNSTLKNRNILRSWFKI